MRSAIVIFLFLVANSKQDTYWYTEMASPSEYEVIRPLQSTATLDDCQQLCSDKPSCLAISYKNTSCALLTNTTGAMCSVPQRIHLKKIPKVYMELNHAGKSSTIVSTLYPDLQNDVMSYLLALFSKRNVSTYFEETTTRGQSTQISCLLVGAPNINFTHEAQNDTSYWLWFDQRSWNPRALYLDPSSSNESGAYFVGSIVVGEEYLASVPSTANVTISSYGLWSE